MRTEGLFAQLVFDHILRVRINTASAELLKKESKKEKAERKAKEKKKNKESNGHGHSIPPSGSSSEAVENGSGSTVITTTSVVAKVDTKKTTTQESKSQAGSISNLLTVDIKNVTDAVEMYGGETSVFRLSLLPVLLMDL